MSKKLTAIGFALPALLMFTALSPLFAELSIKNGESFRYTETEKNGSAVHTSCTYTGDDATFAYTYRSPSNVWAVLTDKSGRPLTISHTLAGNELNFVYKGTSVKMTGLWNGTRVDEQKDFPGMVTGENALLLRAHDFDAQKSFSFFLVQPDKYPKLAAFKMTFTWVGSESVTVPAGNFSCRKIRFTLAGAGSVLYNAWYYITDDNRRIIVKSENMPVNGSCVLEKIEE